MNTAIILAAGVGRRMKSNIPKQYMEIHGRPVLYYTINAFEKSKIDNIILVTGENEIAYCNENVVNKYGFKKVTKIVAGGRERFYSVNNGLKAIEESDYVLIHDGARPFITPEIIDKMIQKVSEYKSCVAGVLSKDTIKICDEQGFVKNTPDRKCMWIVQTPQAFDFDMIKKAYTEILKVDTKGITDDAMIWEKYYEHPVKMIEAAYTNIKITTPEDIIIGEAILKK